MDRRGEADMDSKGEDFIIKQTKILAGIGLGLSAVVVIAVLLLAISVQNTLKSTDEQEQSGWRWREDSQGGLVGNFYDDDSVNYEMENQVIDSDLKDQEADEILTEEVESQIPKEAKELLDYLFDYLYKDRSKMIDIEMCETENSLCYKWKIEFEQGRTSSPIVLAYYSSTKDGEYHQYALYSEIWETYYNEDGEKCEGHTRDSYFNFWMLNSETKEVIPEKIYNDKAENDKDYLTWNERYYDILDLYTEESAP